MRLAQKGDEAVMEVIDSGPGISAAERERVFDALPYSRLARRRPRTGVRHGTRSGTRLGGTVSLAACSKGEGVVFRYRQRRCC